MLVPYYYLFRPNEHLKEVLTSNADLLRLLPKYFLFSRVEGGKAPFVGLSDRVSWAKLLFLTYLIMEFENIPEFKSFFGELHVSLDEFDRWWTVERFGLEETLEGVEKDIDERLMNRFEKTNMDMVDQWINNLQGRIVEKGQKQQ